MKKVLLFILIIINILPLFTAAAAETVLLSQNAELSISGSGFGTTAAALTDGSLNSICSFEGNPQWAVIDLGQKCSIKQVEVATRQDFDQESSRGDWSLEFSNSADFTDDVLTQANIGDVENKATVKIPCNSTKAYRYVRILKNGYLVLAEIKVYGSVAAEEEKTDIWYNYTDVNDRELLNRLELLTTLGCIKRQVENGEFQPDAAVCRDEFVSMLISALNCSFSAEKTDFADISASFAKKEIETAAQLGYISKGAKFNPHMQITADEAIKLVVSAMNYTSLAQQSGGYPIGYRIVASDKKLLKNIDAASGGFTRADAVNIIYNMLNSKMNTVSTVDENSNVEYAAYNDMLYEKFSVKSAVGTVTANNTADLNFSEKTLSENTVKIDGTAYKTRRNESAMLGHRVTYYYNDDGIIYMCDVKNETVKNVNAKDIKSLDDRVYKLENGGKIRFSKETSTVYNGVEAVSLCAEQYKPQTGDLTFIDWDGNGVSDVLIIRDFKENIVKSVGKYYQIIVSDNTEKGTVSAIADGEITLEKNADICTLKLSKGFVDTVSVNETGTAYLNYNGEVIYFESEGEEGLKYAYITNLSRHSGIDNAVEIKMYNGSAEGVYTLGSRIVIDGKSYTETDAAEAYLKRVLFSNGSISPQMIKYSANAALEIKELYTLSGSPAMTAYAEKGIYSQYTMKTGIKKYNKGSVLDGTAAFDTETKVFFVSSKDGEYSFDIAGGDYFRDSGLYHVDEVYGLGGTNPAEAMLIYDNVGKKQYFMFDRYTREMDKDGSEQYRIYAYTGGAKKSYITTIPSTFEPYAQYIKRGDVIGLGLNSDKTVKTVEIIFSRSGGLPQNLVSDDCLTQDKTAAVGSSIWNDDYLVYGTVDTVSDGYLNVYKYNTEQSLLFGKSAVKQISFYDSDEDKIRGMDFRELLGKSDMPDNYHNAVMYIQNGDITSMFVYKN